MPGNMMRLIFQSESGTPAGGLVERKFQVNRHSESVLDFAAKYLFESQQICNSAAPFTNVILFTGPKLLAFCRGPEAHNLPGPDPELLKRGASAPASVLDGNIELFTTSRRSGDVVFWRDLQRIRPRANSSNLTAPTILSFLSARALGRECHGNWHDRAHQQ
jgi:hypothetical protein